ncbi:hypothetical protein CGLO_14879 [Colletotrichum gloeosporioides Cg-14]|uniref:Uncharacterized protein n=1 Tax=Colletotrichum gloeosporioides (strain Cg-14) TaxID=1237896 RepID=T0LCQ1_COLGC|nr:hypothetical protein CGLO_14879 [Colletotrichum gloeosporioides Cg-14]
MCRFLYCFP